MELDLRDRAFVVSGAGSGIGLATALRLLREGARVCGFARDHDRLTSAFADVHAAPDRLLLMRGDARLPEDVEAVVDAAVRAFGGVHGVVANAGTGVAAGVDAAPGVWVEQFTTKVGAAMALVHAARPHLIAARGAIVLVNGVSAHHPASELAPVGAARAALANYAATLGTDLAPDGVRVVVVNVGVIETARQRERYERSGTTSTYADWCHEEARRRSIPLQRMGRPDEVGDTIAFLLSDRSSYTTGTSIDVSGGLDGRT
ncbi:SDR family oxidoreductase [Tsukamurella paurometabola]|uniref:SDR family oxidoreductase n=1 Tax=Tsukamurella paurometabola TaxID=2061 RepID=A0ABS5NCQ2_TSUPA|nr:SDR family oxidoreductase [Tsukamurella paurometabola]MBS4102065.1 SDR family oxidoreductase [Tsukamurella paurometabola]